MNAILAMRRGFLCLVFLSLFFSGFSQSFPVAGKITDPAGNALAGATVTEKGTSNSTVTNNTGNFKLVVGSSRAVLTVSSVGFQTQELQVNGISNLTTSLATSNDRMEDVVVIGYGTQKRRQVTAAVSSFDASKLDERPVIRADQALVGQMAGVTVKQTTGALGKGMSVQIRGTGSVTAGNEPLYVVDGFPLEPASQNRDGNFPNNNPLDNLNPNDIESIQVLKDAASAAIYGSRANNGVVIVTTKRGKTGKPSLNLNVYGGYSERSRKLDMLSAEEWVDRATEIINAQWVASAPGRTASQTNEQRRVILGLAPGIVNTSFMTDDRWAQPGHPGLRYIDWQDETFRKGGIQNYQLSASGGTNIVKYYASGNYSRQEGMVIHTNYTSYSTRVNLEVTPNQRVKFGVNINPSYSINNDPGVEGKDNILHQLVSFTPVQEDTMGLYPNIGANGQYRWSVSPNSPVGKLEYFLGQTRKFRSLLSVYGEVEIIKGLSLRSTVNLDNIDNVAKSYRPFPANGTQASRATQGTVLTSGSYNTFRFQNLVNENTLTFVKTVAQRHNFNVLAGYAYNVRNLEESKMASNGGYTSAVITTLNAATAITASTNESRNTMTSLFGRLMYDYDGKYLLSVSARNDGSSRFGKNNRYAFYPSASIGWRISEEGFMKGISFLNDLKLRASYGGAGNYNIGDYASVAQLGFANYTFNGAQATGQAPNVLANPDLGWERAVTLNFGLDATIIRNRISIAFDIYNRKTSSLLFNVPVMAVTGFNSALSNAGSVRNKGWELEVTSRNTTGAFQWSTSFNLTRNSNKVESLPGGQQQLLIPSSFDISHSILKVGEPLYSIYVVRMDGILTQDDINKGVALYGTETVGDPKYFDYNGDGVIDANDRMILGHPSPDYIYGMTNTFRYKGFDLSVLVQGQSGGSIYSLLGRALGRTGQGFTDNALGTYRNRWRSATDPGDGRVSKAYSTFGRIKNTDWLYSSDYIRVRNISLGYNLGNAVKMKGISNIRLYVTLENFFGHDKYLGGFNPEATNTDLSGSNSFPEPGDYGGLPLPRSLIVGLNVGF